MQKVEKILVPIDFSAESGAALRDAVSLVRETKAQFSHRRFAAGKNPRSVELRRADSRLAGHDRITKLIRMGSRTREISAVIREEHVDLLVLKLRKRFVFADLGALNLSGLPGDSPVRCW